MYKMLIYISGSIYETSTGVLLPNELVNERKVGYIEGRSVADCEEKFKKIVPEGFLELKKNASGN